MPSILHNHLQDNNYLITEAASGVNIAVTDVRNQAVTISNLPRIP